MEKQGTLPHLDISVVIPAYNEEKRLPETLPHVLNFLESQDRKWEVLVVDDGSVDRTAEIVEQLVREHPGLELVRERHGGKGHAVRSGMQRARGAFVFLSDVDLSVPIEDLPRFLPALETAEVAIGSREGPGAIRYNEPAYRHWMGRIYNLLVRVVLLPGIHDTQCGFKGFRREAATVLFARQGMSGWGFDVEILYMARQRGYKVAQVPVHWTFGLHSRVRPVRAAWDMVRDLLRVRWQAWRGYYRG